MVTKVAGDVGANVVTRDGAREGLLGDNVVTRDGAREGLFQCCYHYDTRI